MAQQHFAVFTVQKEHGTNGSGGLSVHIERGTWENGVFVPFFPKSVIDKERDKLNKDYILAEGVGRSQAIANRIKSAGITRKIRDDQVRSFTIICQSDHEKMLQIEREGKLDEWAADCIAYCKKTFGDKNVVAATLHMGERTPHLHITVVPIVQGETKPRKPTKAEQERTTPKRRYKKQQLEYRLCCKDVISKPNLSRYQTEFAQVMKKWGMVRGIEGSDAKRVDPKLWNEFQRQLGELKKELQAMEEDGKQAKEKNKALKSENTALQVGNTFKKAGVAIGEGVSAIGEGAKTVGEGLKTVGEATKGVFGQSKKDKEINSLKEQLQTLQTSVDTKIQEGLATAKADVDRLTKVVAGRDQTIRANERDLTKVKEQHREQLQSERDKTTFWRSMCEKFWPSAIAAIKAIVERTTNVKLKQFTPSQIVDVNNAMMNAKDVPERIDYAKDLLAMANQDLPDTQKGGMWFRDTSEEVMQIAKTNGNIEQLLNRGQGNSLTR